MLEEGYGQDSDIFPGIRIVTAWKIYAGWFLI